MIKHFIVGVALAVALAPLSRPAAIVQTHNAWVKFDDGTCATVLGLPHVGSIGSFWRPDPLHGVMLWGFTQDDQWYDFIPTWC